MFYHKYQYFLHPLQRENQKIKFKILNLKTLNLKSLKHLKYKMKIKVMKNLLKN